MLCGMMSVSVQAEGRLSRASLYSLRKRKKEETEWRREKKRILERTDMLVSIKLQGLFEGDGRTTEQPLAEKKYCRKNRDA